MSGAGEQNEAGERAERDESGGGEERKIRLGPKIGRQDKVPPVALPH